MGRRNCVSTFDSICCVHHKSDAMLREHNYGDSASSIETEDRTYYYTLEWRDHLIDSRQFYLPSGHNNPKKFPIESVIHTADAVYINGYELGTEVKNKFNDYIELASDTRPEDLSIKLHLGLYYHSNDVFRPEVGDIRLLFYVAGLEGQVVCMLRAIIYRWSAMLLSND